MLFQTRWTLASEPVLGFANAKYKGTTTSAMNSAGISEFHVFDGLLTFTKSEYEKYLT